MPDIIWLAKTKTRWEGYDKNSNRRVMFLNVNDHHWCGYTHLIRDQWPTLPFHLQEGIPGCTYLGRGGAIIQWRVPSTPVAWKPDGTTEIYTVDDMIPYEGDEGTVWVGFDAAQGVTPEELLPRLDEFLKAVIALGQ